MYQKRQLVGVRLWLSMLCPFVLAALLPLTASAQCTYNEGVSPTFNISGNNTASGYTTVVIAADEAGSIAYISAAGSTKLPALAVGKYNVYSFNYQGAAPSALAVGSNVSGLLSGETCAALSSPISIGVCKCTDELPASGPLTLSLTASGHNASAGYSQQYIVLGADGKISNITNTPNFEFSGVSAYTVYGINYKTGGLSGLAVGNELSALTGDCFDLTPPVELNVCPANAMPVTLISFEATAVENVAHLSWSTSEETNSDRFDIQRSANGKDWKVIGSVKSEGESKVTRPYSFIDVKPITGINLYRLKMIDRDSTFAFSSIKNVRFDNLIAGSIFPNPVSDQLTVKVADWKQVKNIAIHTLAGVKVYSSGPVESGSIDVSGLESGIYVLRITALDGSDSAHKFVRVR
ncbi:Por secretion system C-terminal sorting domain-containing protein [Dyadobacter soli]|uniref:Por secretion system C-terminal sorting domain-containing protein n=1 Tax=Dyadobacter soli TaxID=659014 RepID=A0A1G7FEB8_9BACT|nr:T9SS type A sorting domain-containing protein [Dyadobacter soli]SDE74246.1 Por secretion system C-terminal sorting domain-containing protein [Dyadobacter soli]